MNITKEFDKESLDKSIQTSKNDYHKELVDGISDIATSISKTISKSLDSYKKSNNQVYNGIEICENLVTALDDIINRSPYSMSSSVLLLDAYWYNKQAEKKLAKLREWLKEIQEKKIAEDLSAGYYTGAGPGGTLIDDKSAGYKK